MHFPKLCYDSQVFKITDKTSNEKKTDGNTLPEANEMDDSIKADIERKVVRLLNEAKQKIQEEILNSKLRSEV